MTNTCLECNSNNLIMLANGDCECLDCGIYQFNFFEGKEGVLRCDWCFKPISRSKAAYYYEPLECFPVWGGRPHTFVKEGFDFSKALCMECFKKQEPLMVSQLELMEEVSKDV